LKEDNNYFWFTLDGEKKLFTENFTPQKQVYKEKLLVKDGIEYRNWEPFRSKLAACIMNGLQEFPFQDKTSVLYLGVSTGTTISHISDIVGPNGMIFGIEHSSRVARDFLDRVAVFRKNIVPIIQDAKRPDQYFSVFTKVDVVYVDIAQPEQTKIAIDNCKMYLKKGGFLFLVIKARSIDVTKDPNQIIKQEIKKLENDFEIHENIDLRPFDKDHAMIVAKSIN
jgi:fibrillarin-like pre-rRNA processing protein